MYFVIIIIIIIIVFATLDSIVLVLTICNLSS